ncbi:TPA: hypothetical protein PMB18_001490 [Vibrio cholerae]|nr:hypothetical protein [Vibrio cholerae]
MRLVTYEQRLAQIMTVEDLDRQINNSIKYVKRIEAKIKKNAFSIEQKLLYGNNVDANISGLR